MTIGQAIHWFDVPTFYHQVKLVLKRPHGVIAAWCYTVPQVNQSVNAIFRQFYFLDSRPYWHQGRNLVLEKYGTIDFPFETVDEVNHTGPLEFKAERVMDFNDYIMYGNQGLHIKRQWRKVWSS